MCYQLFVPGGRADSSQRNTYRHRHRTSHAVFSTQLYIYTYTVWDTQPLCLSKCSWSCIASIWDWRQEVFLHVLSSIWIQVPVREREISCNLLPPSLTHISHRRRWHATLCKWWTKCQPQPQMNSKSMSSLSLIAEAAIQKQHAFMLR